MGLFQKIFGKRKKIIKEFIHDESLEKKIRRFNKRFPDRNVVVPISELLMWHHILTGGCRKGQRKFCREHNIDLNGEGIVNRFLELAKTAFNGDRIEKLQNTKPEAQQ